jgi:lipopolysaccharide assembly protein A
MRVLVWLVRAAAFFALFAFALNNQHDASVHWFFGQEWRGPMVFVVLGAFALGCAMGVLAMLPGWWRHRRLARKQLSPAVVPAEAAQESISYESALPQPPRDGL